MQKRKHNHIQGFLMPIFPFLNHFLFHIQNSNIQKRNENGEARSLLIFIPWGQKAITFVKLKTMTTSYDDN